MADDRDLNQDAGGDAGVSIHDALSSAFEADESGTGASETGVQAPVSIPATPQSAAPADGRARDETGRFVAKPGEAAQNALSEPPKPQAGTSEPPAQETIGPPRSWTAAAKAKFASLDPAVQQEVLKREGEIEQGKAQWQQGAERLNRLESLLAPRRGEYAVRGVDDHQRLQRLVAAEGLLEQNPAAGIAFLARDYGVDLRQLAFGLQQQGQAANQPPMDPRVAQLTQQVETLTHLFTQQTRQPYADQISAFAADPKHLYFENVVPLMEQFLRGGTAKTLDEAYAMACRAHPEVHALFQQQTQDDQARQAQARAQAARHASGSITGSPSPGASPAGAGPSPSIRDALEQAFDNVA